MRHRAWLWWVLVSACAQDEVGATDDRTIEGVVLDEFTEQGIQGAKIEFMSDALDRAETISEGGGRFLLRAELTEGVRFGTLEASRDGYSRSPKISVYFDGSQLRTELRLRPRD